MKLVILIIGTLWGAATVSSHEKLPAKNQHEVDRVFLKMELLIMRRNGGRKEVVGVTYRQGELRCNGFDQDGVPYQKKVSITVADELAIAKLIREYIRFLTTQNLKGPAGSKETKVTVFAKIDYSKDELRARCSFGSEKEIPLDLRKKVELLVEKHAPQKSKSK